MKKQKAILGIFKAKITSYYCCLFILVFCLNSITGQNSGSFERITTDNGLSQSDINAIYQDRDGFMWFGTHDGLNKYDGYSFKIFNTDPSNPNSITNNLIFDLAEDHNGNLWMATTGGGLIFFDRSTEKFTTYKNDRNDVKSINSNHVATVYVDKENRLWVGTSMGLSMADLKDEDTKIKFKRFRTIQVPYVTEKNIRSVNVVYEDSKGQIWIGGFGGIYKLSRDVNGELYFRFLNEDTGLPDASVRSIAEKEGRLIIATDKGLYLQSKEINSLKMKKIIEGAYNKILIDNTTIWAGTQEGLWKLESLLEEDAVKIVEKFVFNPINPNSISKNNVISLFKDKTGIIWAGTNGGGVNKFDPNKKQFHHIRKTLNLNSLSHDKVRAFFEDSNNNLWVGTEGGGLNMLKKSTNYSEFIVFDNIQKVYTIEEIKRGNRKILLFGGQGISSLSEMDITYPEKITKNSIRRINQFSNSIFSLLVDSQKRVWVGTYNGGVYRCKKNGHSYDKSGFFPDENDPKSISDNIIRNIYEDSKKNIWFATSNGLNMLSQKEVDEKYPKFEVYKNIPGDITSLSHNYILSVYESKAGTIWVGTFGGGLNKLVLNPSNGVSFKSYTVQDGLPNNVIKGILEDEEGYLWLSTNKGLSKFNPEREIFKNYDVNDGLQSNEFQELAYLKRKNGDMLFGGVNGFNIFNPKNLRDNTFIPKTVVTQFLISNKSVSVGESINGKVLLNKTINETEGIELKHAQNNISFEFSALHYAAPEKNKFKYKLEGFDNDWEKTTANKRYAAYTNLSPGNYVFKVKSSNNDGLWNEEPSEVKLKIQPPFWLTGWAFIVYILMLIGILLGVRSYYQLQSKERAAVKIQKELKAVNKLKLQFFTNISHDFKTPITLILSPLEEILESVNIDLSLKPKLKIIERNANSLLRLVNQLMEFRKIEVGETKLGATNTNIINFVREITFSFRALAKEKNIALSFESQLYAMDVWFDWDKLEKILNNIIFNAIKFTNQDGYIIVRVSKPKDKLKVKIKDHEVVSNYIKIEVEDNGIGIEKGELPYVFQRFYQVNKSGESQSSGSGIGLAITKDLVDLHHGEIGLKSEVGKGSCFILKFPLGDTHLLPEEIIEISSPEPLTETQMDEGFDFNEKEESDSSNDNGVKSKSSILIVDDNIDIRKLIKDKFDQSYQIFEADNGKKALNIALKEIPDLIVSDVLMPEMDGIEFCHAIKNNIRTSHIPVILLTALNSVEHRIEGLESGADAYMPKPFKMKLLAARVENLIKSAELMRKRFQTEKELTPEKVTLNSIDEEFLKKIMRLMEENMSNEAYWVDELAFDMNTSRSTFFRKLKKLTGQSPNDFIRMIRLKRAAQLLEENQLTIAQVSYMIGFNDPNYFSKCFRKVFGEAPSRYSAKEPTISKEKKI